MSKNSLSVGVSCSKASNRICVTCHYYELPLEGTSLGECRISPPEFKVDSRRGVWPRTAIYEWCGEWCRKGGVINEVDIIGDDEVLEIIGDDSDI